jgi:hypothetical protein
MHKSEQTLPWGGIFCAGSRRQKERENVRLGNGLGFCRKDFLLRGRQVRWVGWGIPFGKHGKLGLQQTRLAAYILAQLLVDESALSHGEALLYECFAVKVWG